MTNNRSDRMAFQSLLADLVENILKYSDNPGACAQYITTQIRELIGVRIVALLSVDEQAEYNLVGLCPAKREDEWHQPEIQAFIAGTLTVMSPCFIDPETDREHMGPSSAGIGKSFVIPLIVGNERVGMLLLLDLMDEAGASTILDVLTRIASILALILKNSLLYKRLEQRVAERTADLRLKIAELKQSEERFDQLAEHSRTFNWEVDTQGLYTYISPVSEHVLGYRPDELVGKKHYYDLHPEAGREEFKKNGLENFERRVSVKDFVNPMETKDGSIVWVSTSDFPLFDEEGRFYGYRGSDTDITERTLAEEELSRQKALFEAIFKCIPDAVIYTNVDREVIGINLAFSSMFGFTLDDLAGKTTSFFYESPEEYERQGKFRYKMTTGERPLPYEIRYRKKDGSTFPGETLGTAIKSDKGTVIGFIGVIRDITSRKQAEVEKQELEQQLQHTQKLESLGVLSGGIAHDFNNILAIIIGRCSLAGMEPEKAGKHIPEIEKAANRAAELCRQMLAYAGKAQLAKTRVDMQVLVTEMVAMLKATLPPNAVIRSDLSAKIATIEGDASQLRQIVMNLIINASEAIGAEQGEIRVSLARTVVTADYPVRDYHGKAIPSGEYVCLEVTDNGCGMDEETKWRIFEPFYSTKFIGRGLGMSAVLGIIMSHNGALQLFSKPGEGTTFKIYLPAPAVAENEQPLQVAPPVPWRGSGTILLVEDEEQIRFLAKSLLAMFGFTVLEAVNGKEALELYQVNRENIRLVLTDMGMPVMDGLALFNALKQIDPALPVIISSGFGDADITSRISTGTIAGLISKPYSPVQLQKVLKTVLTDTPASV